MGVQTPCQGVSTKRRKIMSAATGTMGTTQCLTFKLGDEVFALDIAKTREVLKFATITKVPRTPSYMCGVINLRGSVVPVIDMRLKFGLPAAEMANSRIIIVEVAVDEGLLLLGALVDSVREVITLGADQIEPPPKIGMRLKTEFIRGMGKKDNHFIIILDIDKVFSAHELAIVQDAGDDGIPME